MLYRRRTETMEVIQLTSTNGAEVAAFCNGTYTDGTVYFPQFEELVPVPVGYYVPRSDVARPFPPDEFEANWISNDGGSLAVAFGSSGISGTIAAGGIKDVPITLSRQMLTDRYQAAPGLTSGSSTLLGTIKVQGVVARTKSTVTVRIENQGLTALVSPAVTVSCIAVESAG